MQVFMMRNILSILAITAFCWSLGLSSEVFNQSVQLKSPATGRGLRNHVKLEGNDADTLILAGDAVGMLHLRDPEAKFYELFPRKPNMDERHEYPGCGVDMHWLDLDRNSAGVFALSKRGMITQIEASTPRYGTPEGITVNSSPEDVRSHYKGMRAYVALDTSYHVFGDRDLVYWVDWKKGIAFSFSYSDTDRKRDVYKVIVFPSGGKFCREGAPLSHDNWRELAPYSLEPGGYGRVARTSIQGVRVLTLFSLLRTGRSFHSSTASDPAF
jgi:hypothetical protein